MNLSPEKLRKLEPYLAKLPSSVREMVCERPGEMAKILQIHKTNSEREFPSVGFVPNVGQERALGCLAQRRAEWERFGGYPHKIFVLGGNGSGKTCAEVAIVLAGACLGPKFVNQKYCNWEYFYDCEKIRKKRKLYVRLVCDAADVKEGAGSMWQQITKWIPTAVFSDKTADFYKTVKIGDVIVDIKTHSQDVNAHAGPDYDLVLFNEPPPEDIYRENLSRTRGRGRLMAFLTPLDLAAYLYDEVYTYSREGSVWMQELSIWDNCRDNPPNRGAFLRAEIENMIEDWQKDPDTLEARVSGKFAHLSGTIFKIFGEQHIVDPFPIDSKYNLYFMCDPHLVKPPYGCWIAKNALGIRYVVAEYPAGDWPSLRSHGLTIEHFCKDFDLMEAGKLKEFTYMKRQSQFRIGDPNIFPTVMPNSGRSLQTEYSLCGWDFDVDVCDDQTLGFEKIKDLLYWNQKETFSASNMPKLFVFRTCPNMIRALREYGTKKLKDQALGQIEKIDKTWECQIACLRYFAMKEDDWNPNAGEYADQYGDDEYAAIRRGRIGKFAA